MSEKINFEDQQKFEQSSQEEKDFELDDSSPELKMHRVEGEQYGEYSEKVYDLVLNVMDELNILSKNKKNKIKRHHQLPAEVVFIIKKIEEAGYDIDNIPENLMRDALKYSFGLVDRKNDYDRDLMGKIGTMEILRWRQGGELKNSDSFYKIVASLRDNYVAEVPKTIVGQQPRVRLAPKGSYHKKQNL